MVGWVFDERFLQHLPPSPHPERPERAIVVRDALLRAGADERLRIPARPATEEEILRVHTLEYWRELSAIVPGRSGWIDADTYYSPGTWQAALAAAGAAIDLALASVEGRSARGFAVVRPPGHHAEPDRAMGFCLLNNVALAAAAARAAGCARVAIVDWDVHHGNGTQAAFYRDSSILYVSTHEWPLYPGTGASVEIGEGEGRGTTVNIPLPAGSGDAEYAAAFDEIVAPALRAFRPDLVLVSAGYDAFVADPLAAMRVTVAGYRRMAEVVRAVADEVCEGRLVCVLEGGYDLDGLGACAAATFDVLARPKVPPPSPARGEILHGARVHLDATRRALAGHWGFGS